VARVVAVAVRHFEVVAAVAARRVVVAARAVVVARRVGREEPAGPLVVLATRRGEFEARDVQRSLRQTPAA
jgi:hypothetical protein